MGKRWFDDALAWLVGLGGLVVLCGCGLRAGWVVPPDEGVGPFLSPGRQHTFRIVLVVAVVVVVACLLRALVAQSGVPVLTAVMVAVIVGGLALAMHLPRVEAELRADGFSAEWYRVPVRQNLTFYNTGEAAVTVCLGIAGDCDAAAPGPGRLRSPGRVVPPNRRVAVAMPRKAGEFKLTLAGTGGGFTRRDAILYTYVPDSAS